MIFRFYRALSAHLIVWPPLPEAASLRRQFTERGRYAGNFFRVRIEGNLAKVEVVSSHLITRPNFSLLSDSDSRSDTAIYGPTVLRSASFFSAFWVKRCCARDLVSGMSVSIDSV